MKFLKNLDVSSITDENALNQLGIGYPGVLYMMNGDNSAVQYLSKKQYFFIILLEKTNSFAKESYTIKGVVNGNPVTFTGVLRTGTYSGMIVYYARIPVEDSNIITLNSLTLTDSGDTKSLYVGREYYYSGGGSGGSLTPDDSSLDSLLKDSGYTIAQAREIVKDSSNENYNTVIELLKSKGILVLGSNNGIFVGGNEPVKFINSYSVTLLTDIYYNLYGDVGFTKNDIFAGGVVTLAPDTEA